MEYIAKVKVPIIGTRTLYLKAQADCEAEVTRRILHELDCGEDETDGDFDVIPVEEDLIHNIKEDLSKPNIQEIKIVKNFEIGMICKSIITKNGEVKGIKLYPNTCIADLLEKEYKVNASLDYIWESNQKVKDLERLVNVNGYQLVNGEETILLYRMPWGEDIDFNLLPEIILNKWKELTK